MENKFRSKYKSLGTVCLMAGSILIVLLYQALDRLTIHQMLFLSIVIALFIGVGAILRD